MFKLTTYNLQLKTTSSRILVIWFLVTALSLSSGNWNLTSAQETSKEDEAMFVARKAFDDGFYDVSLGLLERFLKNFPNSPKQAEANLLVGRCYFQQGKFLDALNKFNELQDKPQARDIKDALLYWTAEVHFKGNNFGKASDFYKRVINDFPKSSYAPVALYSLGWSLFEEQDYKAALEDFKDFVDKYPNEPQAQDAYFKIIECLYNLKDYAALKNKVKSDIKIYSKDQARSAYLNFYLAEADYYLNNFNDSIDEYSKVISSAPDQKFQVLSKLGLGWSYLKLKRYKEAETLFSELNPQNLDRKSADALLLAKAALMVDTNRVNEAVKIYDELLNSTQDGLVQIQAYLGKADALYNLAEYPESVKVYKEALSNVSQNTPGELVDKLHYNLAWSYLKVGNFKEAIKEFQSIVRESGDNIVKVSALCQIGDTYQDSGDYTKAQETYDTIIKNYPDSSYSDYVQYQLGLILLKSENYDGAIMSFLTLKRNYPQSTLLDDASYALGLSYFQRQDYESSRETFLKFQDEFKDSNLKPQAFYLLGTSFFNLGKFPEAIAVFKNIVGLYGQDKDLTQKAEYEIADCYSQMGNELEAMNLFSALRSKYPDSSLTAEIMWWLGEYYYRHDDLEMARRYFSSLIKDFPNSNLIPDAYYAIGSSYEEESKYDEALTNLKKVLGMGSSDLSGQAAIAIADIYVKQNNTDMAINAYEDVLKSYPHLANLIYPKIAQIYLNTNNYARALEFYRKSMDLVPVKEMPSIQFKIAEVLESQGNLPQAIEEYLKVSYLYSENNELSTKALLRVAQIYEGKENFKEALKIYKRIIGMKSEEAKYAQERIDWIDAHTKGGH